MDEASYVLLVSIADHLFSTVFLLVGPRVCVFVLLFSDCLGNFVLAFCLAVSLKVPCSSSLLRLVVLSSVADSGLSWKTASPRSVIEAKSLVDGPEAVYWSQKTKCTYGLLITVRRALTLSSSKVMSESGETPLNFRKLWR